MTNRRNGIAEQNRLERALESIAAGEEGYALALNPVTGEIVVTGEVADEDRLPATQMAREGFFCGPGRTRDNRAHRGATLRPRAPTVGYALVLLLASLGRQDPDTA